MDKENIYAERIVRFTGKAERLANRMKTVSLIRLFLALLFAAGIYFICKVYSVWLLSGLISIVLLFLTIMRYHSKLINTHDHLLRIVRINREEVSSLHHDHTPFDNGSEYIDPEHPFSGDLDIFGNGSLFQAINRTTSCRGKEKLAGMMRSCCRDADLIRERQEAVTELSELIDWRQSFRATGCGVNEKEEEYRQIVNWLEEEPLFFSKPFYRYAVNLLPPLMMVWIVLASLGVFSARVPLFFFLFQLMLVAFNLKYVNRKASKAGSLIAIFRKYEALLSHIEALPVKSHYLQKRKTALIDDRSSPCNALKKLTRITSSLDARNNVLAAIALDGLLLYDIRFVLLLEQWMNRYKAQFAVWTDLIAEYEAIASLANYRYNNPGFCVPKIETDRDFILEASGVSHPLIPVDVRVKNDFSQYGRSNLVIVTGANMSGKSTFLRTIGVNMVLAMAGSAVCADRFVVTPVLLYSSIRNTDSLQGSTSYFFAELKRLQSIVDGLRTVSDTYILLDEILKGTNSMDQHSGSERLIANLLQLGAVGIIATHDITLTALSDRFPERIINEAFEIEIEGEKMIFDYKIREGVCRKMNATRLMEQMRIFSADGVF